MQQEEVLKRLKEIELVLKWRTYRELADLLVPNYNETGTGAPVSYTISVGDHMNYTANLQEKLEEAGIDWHEL